jgi:alanine racemase
MLEDKERVYARIDLDAIRQNMMNMHAVLPQNTRMMAVIKTDGYGYGALPIAEMLEQEDFIWGYAAATAEEAFELREGGIGKPVLILGYAFPYAYEKMFTQQIRPAVFRYDMLKELNETVLTHRTDDSQKMKIHIAVDTGMSRIGIKPDESGVAFIRSALSMEGLEVEGIFTHFARADEADLSDAHRKKNLFAEFLKKVEAETGYHIPIQHCANSASIIDMPEASMDMVRAGVTMYGMWPSDEVSRDKVEITPALSLLSHIVYIKDVPAGTPVSYGGTFVTQKESRIATIPVGYGDGYPRSLSGKGYVLIHGQKAPILGRVCMDQFMVDVSDLPQAQEGDVVTLIGKDGQSEITIEELGDLSGRFNYELSCDLNKRIPRVYVRNGKIQ